MHEAMQFYSMVQNQANFLLYCLANVSLKEMGSIQHQCICYRQVRLVECLGRDFGLHLTCCLLTNSSTEVNSTVVYRYILDNKTCNLESLGENVEGDSVIIPRRFFKIMYSWFWLTHCVSHLLHIIVHRWQEILTWDHKNVMSDNSVFTTASIIL
jgi:hypothetical protein